VGEEIQDFGKHSQRRIRQERDGVTLDVRHKICNAPDTWSAWSFFAHVWPRTSGCGCAGTRAITSTSA
jgi:hypothetical protein